MTDSAPVCECGACVRHSHDFHDFVPLCRECDTKPATKAFTLDPYIRRCAVTRVIDGDTLRLKVDLGWNVNAEHNVRLLRVNAPEMKGETKAAGIASRLYVEGWVKEHTNFSDWPYLIRSVKDDAFGRYLVEFYGTDGANLNDDLLFYGYAVSYV